MTIQFQKATPQYLPDCVQSFEHSTLGDTYFQTKESREYAVQEGLAKGTLYVILCDGICAGFSYYIPEGAFHSFTYIHLIAVKQEYRGKGIGKKLLESMQSLLFETKDKVFLVVGDYNPGAKVFYEKMGYQQVGILPDLYRKGVTEYLMMKVRD